MGPELYETLVDVYEAIRASGRLVNVPHAFGRREARPLTTLPRVIWMPSEDTFVEGQIQGLELIQPDATGANRVVQVEEHDLRRGGALIECYAERSRDAERLACNGVLGALSDILRATTNYTIQGGRLEDPEDLEARSWRYVLRVSFRLSCADMLNAYKPTADVGTPRVLNA